MAHEWQMEILRERWQHDRSKRQPFRRFYAWTMRELLRLTCLALSLSHACVVWALGPWSDHE
jgi:hypothetical protein